MNFFKDYPVINYQFGSNGAVIGDVAFQDLTTYVDVIDQLKDRVTSYSYYNILEGDRPDQLSVKMYGRPDLHWTFWAMNDHIRESGWPLKTSELDEWLAENYSGVAIETRTDFWGSLPEGSNTPGRTLSVGDVLTGSVSGVAATVTGLDPDNGQIFLNGSDLYTAGEAATWTDRGVVRTLTVAASTTKLNAIDHYEDANGEQIDIDPTVGGGINTEVTIREMAIRRNDNQKQIRVIKPNIVETIVTTYKSAL